MFAPLKNLPEPSNHQAIIADIPRTLPYFTIRPFDPIHDAAQAHLWTIGDPAYAVPAAREKSPTMGASVSALNAWAKAKPQGATRALFTMKSTQAEVWIALIAVELPGDSQTAPRVVALPTSRATGLPFHVLAEEEIAKTLTNNGLYEAQTSQQIQDDAARARRIKLVREIIDAAPTRR